ncbi:primase [Gurleya vavrai]
MDQMLSLYYNNIFPFELIYKFLECTPNRELSITLQNNIYIRPLSFNSSKELKDVVIKKLPIKIDIGPIYSSPPEVGTEMHAIRKELIFDIDLTDYQRKCCEGKNICDLCFTLIKCASKVLNYILSDILNYKRILYVFSGGRGLHVWVCDIEAQYLDDNERKQIVNFVNKLISNNEYRNDILNILKEFLYYFDDQKIKKENDDDIFNILYVKLDSNVTSDIKHLLKCPFSVHPTSYKISVPMTIEMIDKINVCDIPNLQDVIENSKIIEKYISVFKNQAENF